MAFKHPFYFTFGQQHKHVVAGKVFNKDCVVKILAKDFTIARQKMFNIFGVRWSMQYEEMPNMVYYPSGVIDLSFHKVKQSCDCNNCCDSL